MNFNKLTGTEFCQADGSTENPKGMLNYANFKIFENVNQTFHRLIFERQCDSVPTPNGEIKSNKWQTAYEEDTKKAKQRLEDFYQKNIDINSLQETFTYQNYAYAMENYIFIDSDYGLAQYSISNKTIHILGQITIDELPKEEIENCFRKLHRLLGLYGCISCDYELLDKLIEEEDNEILKRHPKLKLYKTKWKSLFYDKTHQCLFDVGKLPNFDIKFEELKEWCNIWIENVPEQNVQDAIKKLQFFLETDNSIEANYSRL